MDVVPYSNEFDISSNSCSSVVHGRTTLDRGFLLQSLSGGEDNLAVNKNKILFSPLKNIFPFTTAMDGGGSKQYHVLPSAKHDIKSVQGRTDLI